jgi:hypothetical protein
MYEYVYVWFDAQLREGLKLCMACCLYVCVYVSMYICMQMYMYIYIYIYVYIMQMCVCVDAGIYTFCIAHIRENLT